MNLITHFHQRWRQSLRFRLIFAFALFGFGHAALYGWMIWGFIMASEDEIFNRQVEQELIHQLDTFEQQGEFDPILPRHMTLLSEAEAQTHPLAGILTTLSPGVSEPRAEEDHNIHVAVATRSDNQQRFYILFDVTEEQVDHSSMMVLFISVSLTSLLITTLIAVMLGTLISRFMTRPLEALTGHVRALPVGSEFGDTRRFGQDEIGQLAIAFERAIKRNNRFLEREKRFTREVSHELRTPVAVIQSALDLLQLKPDHPQAMARAQRASGEITELIETFLLLGREQSLHSLDQQVDCTTLVQSIVEGLQPDAKVPIRFEVASQPKLNVLPAIFAVLVRNLLSNACRHTVTGSIDVHLDQDQLIVRDTGCGMELVQQEHIGQPYLPKASGNGLGLSIVSRICNQSGWRLVLDSAPSQGTTVQVFFKTLTSDH